MKLVPALTTFLSNIEQSKVNATQALLLMIVVSHPKSSLPELRVYMGSTCLHVFSIFNFLMKKGYVTSEGTKHNYKYTATEKGEQVCNELLTLQ